MVTVTIALDCCPTCGRAFGPVPLAACDAIKPGTDADVLPLRCSRLNSHPADYHEGVVPGWDVSFTWPAT